MIVVFTTTILFGRDDLLIDTPVFDISEQMIEDFEGESGWRVARVNHKKGVVVTTAIRNGTHEWGIEDTEKKVLGVKLRFLDVEDFDVYIAPEKPVSIDRDLMTVKVWVNSNNYSHRMVVVIRDKKGKIIPLFQPFTLNWMGWKQVMVPIPAGLEGQILYFDGFVIHCDPLFIRGGTLYYYLDDISIITRKRVD